MKHWLTPWASRLYLWGIRVVSPAWNRCGGKKTTPKMTRKEGRLATQGCFFLKQCSSSSSSNTQFQQQRATAAVLESTSDSKSGQSNLDAKLPFVLLQRHRVVSFYFCHFASWCQLHFFLARESNLQPARNGVLVLSIIPQLNWA